MYSAIKNVIFVIMLVFGSITYNTLQAQDSTLIEEVTEDVVAISETVTEGHHAPALTEIINEQDPIAAIMHHISDANEFHIWGDIALPLPVIIRKSDGSWSTGLSNQYHEAKDGLILSHGRIVDAQTHSAKELIDLSITKNVAMMLLSLLLLSIIFFSIKSAYQKRGVHSAPKGLQSILEPIISFIIEDIVKPNLGKDYEKYIPYIMSAFFFILINNLLGLVPFFPASANLTGNIAFTLTMAVLTFIVTNINGNKNYWSHIFLMPGIPKILLLIITPLEIIGMFTKPFALMIRLFANMTAGHIIILSLVSLIFILGENGASIGGAIGGTSIAVPFILFMNALELLVAFLQAYIFTLLSAIFIGMAIEEHHEGAH
ncbi:MAG: F0F1 ATP synthase subunit A [Chitinophagales bacterium]|nr:F0F1 ATP synthase subunit A [Chitinophagales bacterium]MCZ2392827.1 F0F1 ATP synthase subunit A [Chitinophagales bacterium]